MSGQPRREGRAIRTLWGRGLIMSTAVALLVGLLVVLSLPQPWWSHCLVGAGAVIMLLGAVALDGMAEECVKQFPSAGDG